MKKKVSILMLASLFLTFAFAQESQPIQSNSDDGQNDSPVFVLFSDDVPRYESFAAGLFLMNQFAVGGWSEYAIANFGGGIDVEYTLPIALPNNMDLGASAHIDFGHTFPKSGTTLKSHNDIRFSYGAWLRIPFTLFGQFFAVQPELSYGLALSHTVGQNGSKANGWYSDQLVLFSPSFRYMLPIQTLKELELEFTPLWTLSPETKGNSVHNFGYRIGAIWHVQDFINSVKDAREAELAAKREAELKAQREAELKAQREEEERILREKHEAEARRLREEEEAKRRALEEAADEAARAKAEAELKEAQERTLVQQMQAELAILRARPALMLGVDESQLENFTPDGDGVHDTISFTPSTAYLPQPAESWSLKIIDPAGNVFRTWGGKGNPEKDVVWDGKSNEGEGVFSYNTYKAVLEIRPCEQDRMRLGLDSMTATVDGAVEIKTGVVLKKTGDNEWKIEMTTVPFDPDAATFNRLTNEQREELYRTVDEVTEKVLSIGSDVSVTVNGYANNVSGTEREDREELIPLSQKRADVMVQMLIQRGVDKTRASAVGRGGADPIASREDRENWWKNRRIEFIIRK